MKLTIHNSHTTIDGATQEVVKILDVHTSYFVKGYYFSPSYKDKMWDGKEHLLRFNRKMGYHFPTGLLDDVINLLIDMEVDHVIEDKRPEPSRIKVHWQENDKPLRPYQDEAVAESFGHHLDSGRLILKMPVRSGKTLVAAKIIDTYKTKTLFVVNSEMLLSQTIKVFQQHLDVDVGQIGGGVWEDKDVTVATIQTLMERGPAPAKPGRKAMNGKPAIKGRKAKKGTPEFYQLMNSVGLLFFDECHHLEAKRWRGVILHSGAKYRIGLSATAFLVNEKENEQGTIWLKACCGPIGYEVPISELIEQGYLAPLDVLIVPITCDDVGGKWPEPYVEGIVRNEERNKIIAERAGEYFGKGSLVLIHAIRLEHIENLSNILTTMGIPHNIMVGETKPDDRRQRVAEFKSGFIPVLMGNLFGEGVDIPECDCVINAAGGESEITTIQRIRNLTACDGKNRAVLIDFADLHNKYLAKHSLNRIETYKKESLFNLLVDKK